MIKGFSTAALALWARYNAHVARGEWRKAYDTLASIEHEQRCAEAAP